MSAQPTTYQPKGGMCMTCQHNDRDCSALPFHSMPVVDRYYLESEAYPVARVRCTEHVKAVQS